MTASDSSPHSDEIIFLETFRQDLLKSLVSIKAYSELIERIGILEERQKDFLNNVFSQVGYAEKTLDELSLYIDIKAGRLDIQTEVLELTDCVDEAIIGVQPTEEAKDCLLAILVSGLPPVRASKVELVNVITFLLKETLSTVQAVQADNQISLIAERVDEFIKVSITDTGISSILNDKEIDAKVCSVGLTDYRSTGTGAWFAFSRYYIEEWGGELGFEREDGTTTFWFTLPIDEEGI